MIPKLTQHILEVLFKHMDKKLSMHQIAGLLKTSYAHVYKKISELIKEKVLLKERIGNSAIITINMESELARNMLSHIEILKKIHFLKNHPTLQLMYKVLKDQALTHGISYAFYFNNKIAVCLENTFLEDSLLKDLKQPSKPPIIIFDQHHAKKYFSKAIIAEKILLLNPEAYYEQVRKVSEE